MNRRRPSRPRVKLNRSAVSELLSLLNMSQTPAGGAVRHFPRLLFPADGGPAQPLAGYPQADASSPGVHDFDRLFIIEPAEEPCDAEGTDPETPSL